jgi:ribosomal protein L3 glutamine methyltransferase
MTKASSTSSTKSLSAALPTALPTAFKNAVAELSTVRDLIRFGVSQFNAAKLFFGHGSLSAHDESVYLVLHTLNLPLDQLDPYLNAALTRGERETVVRVLARRVIERVPAAYLTNEAWLGEAKFFVDERVIVPRSFIAELLREELSPWVADADAVGSVLDLCTGSGCLAILAALTFPNANVDAVDLSADALAVATRNVADYELQDVVRLIKSDLFVGVKNCKYDVIISNPPYVTAASMKALPGEYLREPRMALASGKDGLDHTRMILEAAPKFLNKHGILVVEVGFNREGVEAAFPQLPFTWAETSAGDGVVFLITREELVAAQ